MLLHFDGGGSGTTAQSIAQIMLDRGYSFDFISDRQLGSVEFKNNILKTAGVSYKTIVLPKCYFIPVETFGKLVRLVQKGATIIVHKSLPSDVPGLGHLTKRRKSLHKLLEKIKSVDTIERSMALALINALNYEKALLLPEDTNNKILFQKFDVHRGAKVAMVGLLDRL